jgi:hypothetical protein
MSNSNSLGKAAQEATIGEKTKKISRLFFTKNRNMRSLLLLPFTFFSIYANAQHKNDVQILILDANSKQLIEDSDVSLIMEGNNYGNGSRIPFTKGVVFLRDIPSNCELHYLIESASYYSQKTDLLMKVVNNDKESNSETIYLNKLASKELIIRGKVTERENSAQGISGCQVEISIESAPRPYIIPTDAEGDFFLSIPNGTDLYGSGYSINLHKDGYANSQYEFHIENKPINVVAHLILPRKPPTRISVRVMAHPQMTKTLQLSCPYGQVTESPTTCGLFFLTASEDSIPKEVSMTITCDGCEPIQETISRSELLKGETQIEASSRLRYKSPILSLMGGATFAYLPGSAFVNHSCLDGWIGVQYHLRIANSTFGIGVNLSAIPMYITMSNNYITLPGDEGRVKSSIILWSLPEGSAVYFLSDPLKSKVSAYVGPFVGGIKQVFRGNDDSTLSDPVPSTYKFYVGLKAGIQYPFSARWSIGAFLQSAYLPFRSTTYLFNYFGRALQKFEDTRRPVEGLGVYLLFNLLNT